MTAEPALTERDKEWAEELWCIYLALPQCSREEAEKMIYELVSTPQIKKLLSRCKHRWTIYSNGHKELRMCDKCGKVKR